MGLFKAQSSLTLKIFTYIELTGAEACLLKYRKPSGDEGSFALTIEDETEGILRYNAKIGDLDEDGWWCVWAHITFINGRTAPGEPAKIFIYEEGVM